jgi:hypothetical protein
MAYGKDARLALTIQTILPANRLVLPIEAITPLGLRQCPCPETYFWAGLGTTAEQLTCITLINRAESEFLGTTPFPTAPTTVIYVSHLRTVDHTSSMSKQGSRCAFHAPLVPQP